jgi:hypothetical protein
MSSKEPLAWAVMQTDSYRVFSSHHQALIHQEHCAGGDIVPLYSSFNTTNKGYNVLLNITNKEYNAIIEILDMDAVQREVERDDFIAEQESIVRNLLKRIGEKE